jgi:hypothetical protein
MSSAGTAQLPLPCGVSDITVVNANLPIRDYDYTYNCDGSFLYHVTSSFDTRPFNNDPANTNKHLTFEMLKDGDTQITVLWLCPIDPWGVADTTTCTQRNDPDVKNPKPSFPVQNGPLPLSVRFLSDSNRQELADALRQALNSTSGANQRHFSLLLAAAAPAGGSASGSGSTSSALLPKAPTAPANFTATRDNVLSPAITLRWDAASGADYYYLTAYSHNGGDPVTLHDPAPKLSKDMTQFMVNAGDNAANLQGGVDFKLQACNAGGCSATLTATVP